MGTDIHAVWQARDPATGKWVDIKSTWEQDRHYFLFAWLAGVRNGFGFAHTRTHAPLTPISDPRGMPEDFEHDGEPLHYTQFEVLDKYDQKSFLAGHRGDRPYIWMGDHTHSWLTADEILAARSVIEGAAIWRCGVISRPEFGKWDGATPPTSYSGGIMGPNIVVAATPVDVEDDTTHVTIFWRVTVADELKYFTDEVERLKELHGRSGSVVRVVFGFDS